MASEYQRSRGGTASTFLANPNITQKKKANNIWGNLLNEEILTADLVKKHLNLTHIQSVVLILFNRVILLLENL